MHPINRKAVVRYLMLSVIAIAMVFPFVWMVSNSFNSRASIFQIPPVLVPDMLFEPGMFANYSRLFEQYNFGLYLFNSLFVSTSSAVGQIVTCSAAGFAFGRMRFPGRRILFALILATMMIPIHATIIPEYLLMNRLGWLNTYAPLIVPSLLIGTFGTLLFTVFFENAPTSMLESAVIDGAGPWQVFARIFLPLARGAIVTLFILAFINNWNDLLRAVLYITDENLMTSTLALTRFQGQYSADWHMLLTGAVVSTAPLLLLYAMLQRYIVEGVSNLGIKG